MLVVALHGGVKVSVRHLLEPMLRRNRCAERHVHAIAVQQRAARAQGAAGGLYAAAGAAVGDFADVHAGGLYAAAGVHATVAAAADGAVAHLAPDVPAGRSCRSAPSSPAAKRQERTLTTEHTAAQDYC